MTRTKNEKIMVTGFERWSTESRLKGGHVEYVRHLTLCFTDGLILEQAKPKEGDVYFYIKTSGCCSSKDYVHFSKLSAEGKKIYADDKVSVFQVEGDKVYMLHWDKTPLHNYVCKCGNVVAVSKEDFSIGEVFHQPHYNTNCKCGRKVFLEEDFSEMAEEDFYFWNLKNSLGNDTGIWALEREEECIGVRNMYPVAPRGRGLKGMPLSGWRMEKIDFLAKEGFLQKINFIENEKRRTLYVESGLFSAEKFNGLFPCGTIQN